MKKMRCERCLCYQYNFISGEYERHWGSFCGLHGGTQVDPKGEQMNLDGKGSCGFIPKVQEVQLSFEFD